MRIQLLAASLLVVLGAAGTARAAKMLHYKGKITAHPSGKLHVAVDDGSTGDWTLDEKAVATRGRSRVPLNELHVGDEVALAVSEDGVIHQVKVLRSSAPEPGAKQAAAPGPAYWATPKGKGRWWSGEVFGLKLGAQEFGVRREGAPNETTHFKADGQTAVYVAPKQGPKHKSSFGVVRDGARVDAYAMDGRTTQIIVHEP